MVVASATKPPSSTSSPSSVKPKVFDILVGIDGTSSEDWLTTKDREDAKWMATPRSKASGAKPPATKPKSQAGSKQVYRNSHVWNFVHDFATPDTRKRYFDGPGDLGFNTGTIVDSGFSFVTACLAEMMNERKALLNRSGLALADLNVRISLIGHSRGALIAIRIAKRLRDHKLHTNVPTLSVHFMGLYDAVDRQIGEGGDTIPGNVAAAYHALRDPTVQSRSWFGNTGTKAHPPCRYTSKVFTATHSGVGGDPWGGDKPKQITKDMDMLGSEKVGTWMIDMAKKENLILVAAQSGK